MRHSIFNARHHFRHEKTNPGDCSHANFNIQPAWIMRAVSTSLFNIKEFPAHLIYELVSRFHDDMSRYFPTGLTNVPFSAIYIFRLKMLEITFGFFSHFLQKMLKMSIFIRHFQTKTMLVRRHSQFNIKLTKNANLISHAYLNICYIQLIFD